MNLTKASQTSWPQKVKSKLNMVRPLILRADVTLDFPLGNVPMILSDLANQILCSLVT